MFDSVDMEIIRALQKDARTPFSDIAKSLGVSPSIIQIRFNKMKKSGLILGTTLTLNPEKFGVKYLVSIGVKALEPEVDDVIKYMRNLAINGCKILIWPTFGRFNISSLIMSRNLLEARKIRESIKEHPSVTAIGLSLTISWYSHNYDSLGLEKELRE